MDRLPLYPYDPLNAEVRRLLGNPGPSVRGFFAGQGEVIEQRPATALPVLNPNEAAAGCEKVEEPHKQVETTDSWNPWDMRAFNMTIPLTSLSFRTMETEDTGIQVELDQLSLQCQQEALARAQPQPQSEEQNEAQVQPQAQAELGAQKQSQAHAQPQAEAALEALEQSKTNDQLPTQAALQTQAQPPDHIQPQAHVQPQSPEKLQNHLKRNAQAQAQTRTGQPKAHKHAQPPAQTQALPKAQPKAQQHAYPQKHQQTERKTQQTKSQPQTQPADQLRVQIPGQPRTQRPPQARPGAFPETRSMLHQQAPQHATPNPPPPRYQRYRRNPQQWQECSFCRQMGEPRAFCRSHVLRDPDLNVVVCPILRAHRCELCGATGDVSHTSSHCPMRSKGNYKGTVPKKPQRGREGK